MPPICQSSVQPLLEWPLWMLDSISAFCQDHLPNTCFPSPGTDSFLAYLCILVLCSDLSNHALSESSRSETFTFKSSRPWAKLAEFQQDNSVADRDQIGLAVLTLDHCSSMVDCRLSLISPHVPRAIFISFFGLWISTLFWHPNFLLSHCHMPFT